MDSTILIIGAGTFGVSTAWHLSQNHSDPSKVTIIDRSFPPSPAAAIDINRILTADYPSSPLYAHLATEALAFWAEDPDLEWYFHRVGRLVLQQHPHPQPPHQPIALDALPTILRGTDTTPFSSFYLDAAAGWVDAATATWQFLETAIRRRVRREVGEVTALLFDGKQGTRKISGARTADGREFRADTVVLATGAWTSALLSPAEDAAGVAAADRVERQASAAAIVSAAFPVGRGAVERMVKGDGRMPCVVYGGWGEVVPPSRENHLLRYNFTQARIVNTVTTGSSGMRISIPPVGRSQREVPERVKVDMREVLLSRLMPGYARAEPTWRMCWDNCTPTEDLLLCEHPQLKDCFIITGGSFNGYKFMPNIGKYMIKVLKRQSNGREMDAAWCWKRDSELEAARNVHTEKPRELRDYDIGSVSRL